MRRLVHAPVIAHEPGRLPEGLPGDACLQILPETPMAVTAPRSQGGSPAAGVAVPLGARLALLASPPSPPELTPSSGSVFT